MGRACCQADLVVQTLPKVQYQSSGEGKDSESFQMSNSHCKSAKQEDFSKEYSNLSILLNNLDV